MDGNYCGSAYYMLLVLFPTYGICIHGKWNYIGVSSNIFVKVIDSKYVYLCYDPSCDENRSPILGSNIEIVFID